ncbi:unnamed protein product [Ixodes persulcatus]
MLVAHKHHGGDSLLRFTFPESAVDIEALKKKVKAAKVTSFIPTYTTLFAVLQCCAQMTTPQFLVFGRLGRPRNSPADGASDDAIVVATVRDRRPAAKTMKLARAN